MTSAELSLVVNKCSTKCCYSITKKRAIIVHLIRANYTQLTLFAGSIFSSPLRQLFTKGDTMDILTAQLSGQYFPLSQPFSAQLTSGVAV